MLESIVVSYKTAVHIVIWLINADLPSRLILATVFPRPNVSK